MVDKEPLRINLNEEQTKRFLSYFVDDAIRIANERKREREANKGEHDKNAD